ncbi:arp2/3 complex-activating protein rickA, partial [Biomphalaria pfeifferi]
GGHKHRSSTLEKITNHLNYSKMTNPVIENGPMPRQQTSNMKASKSANELNIKKKDHFRVIEHVAEVHSTRSEIETRQREIHSHQSHSRLASDEKADANKGSQINISPISVIVEHARDKETEINNRQYTRVDKLHAEQHVQEAPSESQSRKKDVSLKTQFEGASSIRLGNQAENKVSHIAPASHSVRFRNTDSYITINGNPGPPPQRHQTIIQNTFSLSAPPPPPPPPSPPSSAREERINSLKVDIEGRSKSKSGKPSVTPRMSSHAQRSTQHVLETSIVSPANHKQPSVEDPANQPKKQRLFSSPAKTGSKKLSSQANKHSTTISVPFIKIKSDNSPLVAASLSRRDVTSASNDFVPISNDKEFSSEGHRQFSTFHVNSRNTKSPTNVSSAGSSMVETYRNVTRITVGKSSTTRTNLPVSYLP